MNKEQKTVLSTPAHPHLQGQLLPIKTYPDPVLKKVASPYSLSKMTREEKEDLKILIQDMLYTMYHAPGIGLAAPQIGLSKKLFVLDVDYTREKVELGQTGKFFHKLENFNPQIFINPRFIQRQGEIIWEEGCLSVPGIYEKVKRFSHVVLEYETLEEETKQLEATDLFAVCLQHEYDHLEGIVFIEKLSPLKKTFITKKLKS